MSSENGAEKVLFITPKTTSYTDAYNGSQGPAAESTRMPIQRFLVPSLRMSTDYADSFHGYPPRRKKESLVLEHRPLSPISEEHKVFSKSVDDLTKFNGPTNYRDNYIIHDPSRMSDLRGRSTYKYKKSPVIPETPLPPTMSETARAFLPFPASKPEHYVFYPDEGASKYPKQRRTMLTVTPEEATRLTARMYSPKYQKNISVGLFHGPPPSSQATYETSTEACHHWHKDAKRAETCKIVPKFIKPSRSMETDTTHRDHFSGKSIKDRYSVRAGKFPPLEKSESSDEKVAVAENQSRAAFWNAAGTELRKFRQTMETDKNFREIATSLNKFLPKIENNLRPMKTASAKRVRKGHIVGVGCQNATDIPFSGATTYHEEIRWEDGEKSKSAKPHAKTDEAVS